MSFAPTWTHAQAGLGGTSAAAGTSKAITPKAKGNLIIVMGVVAPNATGTNISDTTGQNWVQAVPFTSNASSNMKAWYSIVTSLSANTITITAVGGSANFASITIDEFSGNNVNSPLDTFGQANSVSTTVAASLTTGADGCLIWEGIADSATSPAAPFSAGGTDGSGDPAGYKFLGWGTKGSTQSTAWTGASGACAVGIASFKPYSQQLNNYEAFRADNGISVSEKIR